MKILKVLLGLTIIDFLFLFIMVGITALLKNTISGLLDSFTLVFLFILSALMLDVWFAKREGQSFRENFGGPDLYWRRLIFGQNYKVIEIFLFVIAIPGSVYMIVANIYHHSWTGFAYIAVLAAYMTLRTIGNRLRRKPEPVTC